MAAPVTTVTVFPGYSSDLPLQCRDKAGAKAVYQAGDAITAEIRAVGSSTSSPIDADFFTLGGTQTGSDQGQVLVGLGPVDTALLQTTTTYRITVFRTLAADATKTEPIARVTLVVQPLGALAVAPATNLTIYAGYADDLPFQLFDKANNRAIYQAADTFTADIRAVGATGPLFTIPITWNIKGGAQTGFGQGQVILALTAASTGRLQPGVTYRITIYRQLGSDPTKQEVAGRVGVVASSLAA